MESAPQDPKKEKLRRANVAIRIWPMHRLFQSDVIERAHAQVVDVRRRWRRGEEGGRGVEGTVQSFIENRKFPPVVYLM